MAAAQAQSVHSSKDERIPPSERTLRVIAILTWLPAFALCIPYGVVQHREAWPWIALIPITLSAVFSAAVILGRVNKSTFILLGDFLLALFLGGNASGGIAVVAHRLYHDSRANRWGNWDLSCLLGTYATSMMLLMFCIHAFLVGRALVAELRRSRSWASIFGGSDGTCPHCQREIQAQSRVRPTSRGKETYHRVPGRDDGQDDEEEASAAAYRDARPSVDDESASLV